VLTANEDARQIIYSSSKAIFTRGSIAIVINSSSFVDQILDGISRTTPYAKL